MNWLRKLSIYYKINGIIVGMLLLLSLIIGIIVIQNTARLLDSQMEKRGNEVASYIAALSSNDILLDDHYALFDRINRTKNNNDDVLYILITDPAQRVLAHTFSGNLPKGLPLPLPDSSPALETEGAGSADTYHVLRFYSNEGPVREIIFPIENGAIGFIRVGMSEKTTQQLLAHAVDEFFLTTLFICFVAAFGATHLAYVIIRPVGMLAQAAREIQRGNFSVQAVTRTEDEIGHLTTVFNQMASTLEQKQQENDRLLEELRNKEAMRTVLMNKLYTVQEEERKRLSRELHDETSQSMASLLAYMRVLLSKLQDENQKTLLQGARDVAVNVLEGLRKMAVELRPPVLDDLGIIAAMQKYVTNFSYQHSILVRFTPPSSPLPVSNEISLALYRILQESLTNIAKHAQATQVDITLSHLENKVTLLIKDNGIGIRSGALESARQNNRLGIYGMKERAELLGGSLSFQSTSGQGTAIIVQLPTSLE